MLAIFPAHLIPIILGEEYNLWRVVIVVANI
jgi:hypothetical protein